MNILFLTRSVRGDTRDKITYNFILKEMLHLTDRGDNIFFLSAKLEDHFNFNGIHCIAIKNALETNRVLRVIHTLIFLIKNLLFFKFSTLYDFRKTFHVCKIERAVNKVISEHNIDVIHTHFFYPLGENAILAARKQGVPVIATIRGAEVCDRPDLDYGSLRDRYFKKMLKKTIGSLNHITCPNRSIVQFIQKWGNVDSSKISYVPNGIELTNASKPDASMLSSNSLKLIAVGRLIKLKNYSFLIETFEKLKDISLELTIVGIGYQAELLNNMIKTSKLSNVEIIDELPKKDLFDLISNYHFFIHPSLTEGMPNVVLESLSLGTPVICSDIPAHRDIVEEGYNGFLFDPKRSDELVSIINKVQKHNFEYLQMSENCKISAAKFSLRKKIENYRQLYRSLIISKKCNRE